VTNTRLRMPIVRTRLPIVDRNSLVLCEKRFESMDQAAPVEAPSSRGAPMRSRPPRRDSEYADVLDMFRDLAQLPAGSAQTRCARNRIVERCLPLADHIARRYHGRGEPDEDLLQVARVGLVNAVNRFDVCAGTDFLSFAVPTIMGEVKRYFRDCGWSLSVPRGLKEIHRQLGSVAEDLSQRLARAPTVTELAAELGMERSDVMEGLLAGGCYRTRSIDEPRGGEQGATTIADHLGDYDTDISLAENREALRPLLAELPERDRAIIVMRFYESLTQSQIADRLGLAQMSVSRLLSKALTRLRDEITRSG
jgi:RNA polymerase sigma-B factor